MYATYHNVAIRSIAAAAPSYILSNVEYAATVDDKKYKRRILYTGIKERRHVVGGQKSSDLACIAAEKAMEKLGWSKDSIRVLIYVTETPDIRAPSTAMLLQARMGLSQDLLSYDINLGCTGFTSGVQTLAAILSQTKGRGLLLMGDYHPYPPGTEYYENNILFGAGSAAVAMEYDEKADPMLSSQMTDGTRFNTLYDSYEKGVSMDGNAIVLFSLNEVVDSINEFHTHYGITREQIDFYALHQAQKIIVEGIAQNCILPDNKVLRAYPNYGNTSSASIPFALCANTDKLQGKNLKIFTCGYGIGLAWSSVLITVDSEAVLPLIENDYVYPILF